MKMNTFQMLINFKLYIWRVVALTQTVRGVKKPYMRTTQVTSLKSEREAEKTSRVREDIEDMLCN